MRILLLRMLIGWWMIPIMFVTTSVIRYLIFNNDKVSKYAQKEIINLLWNGCED